MTDENEHVPTTDPHDPSIDVRAIGRDPVALERFYRVHLRDVERFVARRVSDPHTAADLTSEVFMKAMESCRRFDPGLGTSRVWLLGIAYRVVADAERQAARRWRAHSRESGRRVLQDDAIAELDERLDAEAELRELRASYAGLPKIDRALLELTAIDGLRIGQAAAALGLSAGAARVRLHRVKHKLRGDVRPEHSPPVAAPSHAEPALTSPLA